VTASGEPPGADLLDTAAAGCAGGAAGVGTGYTMLTETFLAGVEFMRVLLFQPEPAGAEAVRVKEADLCTGVGALTVSTTVSATTIEGERTGRGVEGTGPGWDGTFEDFTSTPVCGAVVRVPRTSSREAESRGRDVSAEPASDNATDAGVALGRWEAVRRALYLPSNSLYFASRARRLWKTREREEMHHVN